MKDKNLTKKPLNLGVHREGSPYSEEECEVIIKQLEELLDGALSDDEQKKVIQQIESCDYCLEQYKIEKTFRQVLKDGVLNFTNNKIIKGLKDTLKNIKNRHFLF